MSDTLRRPYEELHTENQRLREALREFVEAWWEVDEEHEPMDAAACNALALLGDLIAIAPPEDS